MQKKLSELAHAGRVVHENRLCTLGGLTVRVERVLRASEVSDRLFDRIATSAYADGCVKAARLAREDRVIRDASTPKASSYAGPDLPDSRSEGQCTEFTLQLLGLGGCLRGSLATKLRIIALVRGK